MRNTKKASNQVEINSGLIGRLLPQAIINEVIELSEVYLKSYPNDADVLIKSGASLGILGNFEKAISHFENVKKLQPKDPAPWNNIGTIHKMQNNIDLAIEYYQEALSLDKTHFDSLKNISFCYQDQEI